MSRSGKSTVTLVATCVAAVVLSRTLVGFLLQDRRWPAGQIDMKIQLGPASGLIDGSADWDECVIASLTEWNNHLGQTGIQFNAVQGATKTPDAPDDINSVFFSNDIFGTPFDHSALAATQTWIYTRDGVDETAETDIIFNDAKPFNCYRGARAGRDTIDLRRVALHEFGHAVGLGHPDQDTPPQQVTAIMNAYVSDIDALQTDDIQGALTLYGVTVTGIPFPPRDEVLNFLLSLENEYRDGLGRSRNHASFVDTEGTATWFPEWLRYVLNDCSPTEATARVLLQISGQGTQPVCGVVPTGTIHFPPRNESLDFLHALNTFYRDTLGLRLWQSHVDLEGKAVWLQEYLRYRVNGCNDTDASHRVLQQIHGSGAMPVCSVSASATMTGTWVGDFPFSSGDAIIEVTLSQMPDGQVTGTFSLSGENLETGVVGPEGEPGSIDPDGAFDLRFKRARFADFHYRGSIAQSGQQLRGTLYDPRFWPQNPSMVLNKR